jgi:hypothetical protein
MSFDNKTTAELLRVANAGLGFTLSRHTVSTEGMREISNAAARSGAVITYIDGPLKASENSL